MVSSALSPAVTRSQQTHSGQREACWAGVARLFTATVGRGRRVPIRGCERRAPSLHGAAADASSLAAAGLVRSRDPAARVGPPIEPETDEEAAALLAPKGPETVNKRQGFFGRIAQLFVAAAAFSIWRSPAVEALGHAINQTPLGPKDAHSAAPLKPSAHGVAQVVYAGAQIAAFAAVIWQAMAMRQHGNTLPSAIWVGAHDPHMNISCISLFEVTRWSVFLAVAAMATQLVALILLVLTGFWAGGGNQLFWVMRAVVGVWSLGVLLNTRSFERQACPSLTACMACTCALYLSMTIYDVLAPVLAPVLCARPQRQDPEKARLL